MKWRIVKNRSGVMHLKWMVKGRWVYQETWNCGISVITPHYTPEGYWNMDTINRAIKDGFQPRTSAERIMEEGDNDIS